MSVRGKAPVVLSASPQPPPRWAHGRKRGVDGKRRKHDEPDSSVFDENEYKPSDNRLDRYAMLAVETGLLFIRSCSVDCCTQFFKPCLFINYLLFVVHK